MPSLTAKQYTTPSNKAGAASLPKPSAPSSKPDAPTEDEPVDRLARWKKLQGRAKKSLEHNRHEVYEERRRQATDVVQTSKLARKKAEAEFKLAKEEALEAGEDFERKRAWDWTVDEAERWDRRMEKKQKHVDDVAFQDYTQQARKMYKKQMRELKPDLESYNKAKETMLVKDGLLMETEDGELVAVDKDGDFYADGNSLAFVDNLPEKEAVDRLVKDLANAEKKRMERRRDQPDEDVTYINDKNKVFNSKLARSYNKYTEDIRDSFERGTAI